MLADSACEVQVEISGGMPRLVVDGKYTPPLIFFFNTEVPHGFKHWEPQVQMARDAGVHIYSFCLPWPWYEPGVEPDFSEGEAFMDRFVDTDPHALFIPRLRCEPPDAWLEAHPETRIAYADGSMAMMNSMASERWWDIFEKGMVRAVQHYENSRFGRRIICYHPGSQNTNEWFHYEYWLKGPDYSAANQRGFRRFLSDRYESIDALRHAWESPGATFENAHIPPMERATSPAQGSAEAPFEVFLTGPAGQPRRDFHDYTNEIVADRLVAIAKTIKDACAWRKAVLLFYGYAFEMHGAESGHFAARRVLESDAVDMVSSPLSYVDRQPGGSCSFMTAVDSIPLNGKLWIMENDHRTHALDVSDLPHFITEEALGKGSRNLEETQSIVRREFGSMLTHRCGTWWMDLISGGAWEDLHIWRTIGGELAPLYDELLANPAPFEPALAVIVDEQALRMMRYAPAEAQSSYSPVYDRLFRNSRDVFNRSGISVGYYYIEDFLNGSVPPCKLYWFLNPFALTEEQAEGIRSRLAAFQAAAVWQYAPCVHNLALAERLTGFEFLAGAGPMGSVGRGPFEGLSWGKGCFLDPRLHVASSDVRVLGCYQGEEAVSAARTERPGFASYFIGDAELSSAAVAALGREAGAHLWAPPGCTVYTDRRVLFMHGAAESGCEPALPPGIKAVPLDGTQGPRVAPSQTRVFRLSTE